MSDQGINDPFLPFSTALSNGLQQNFADVHVDEIDCPDLTAAPFHLAASGLGGSKTVLDVGGPAYLLPLADRSKVYDLVRMVKRVLPNAKNLFVCGAGAGPHPAVHTNCEVGVSHHKAKKRIWLM